MQWMEGVTMQWMDGGSSSQKCLILGRRFCRSTAGVGFVFIFLHVMYTVPDAWRLGRP